MKKLETHLRGCKQLTPEDQAAVMSLLEKENVPPMLSTPGPSRNSTHWPSTPLTPVTPLASGSRQLKRARTSFDVLEVRTQAEFEVDVCKLFVACQIPWNAAQNPQMRKFTQKWITSDVVMPDRRILSGRVLNGEVEKVEAALKDVVKAKFATGQCDGWKNTAKVSVVSTAMTVGNEVSIQSYLDVASKLIVI